MAAQHNINITPTTFIAAIDFAACPTTQYRMVKAGSVAGEVTLGSGASANGPLGVLQDSPSAGQGAALILLGPTKMAGRVSTCNLNWGQYVVCASDGFAESSTNAGGWGVTGIWLGPTITSGSVIGEALFYGGLSTCNIAR